MTLSELGWTPALDYYFTNLDEPSWIPARVSRVGRGRAAVVGTGGEQPASWRSPIPVVDGAPLDIPATGDWCAVSHHAGLFRIETILPRAACIARGVDRGDRAAQVLAANVDVAFIVTGLDGDFSLRRIERYLVLVRSSGVRPVVVLNKCDLCDEAETRTELVRHTAPAVTLLSLSALATDAPALLHEQLAPGQTAVFLGSSGAGKSTLIHGLLGEARQATASVRAKDDRGRHTTTTRDLILLTSGRVVIDTPGLRAVGILGDERSLDGVFTDIASLATGCRFPDCRHGTEPDCAVREAISTGAIAQERVALYLELRRESENAAIRRDAYAHRQQERKTIGRYKKWLRESNRLKGRS